MTTSRSDASALSPVDELAVRRIVADIDRITARDGQRRIDIALACLRIVVAEIALNAPDPAAAKRHAIAVARHLKAEVAAAVARRGSS